MHKHLIIAAFDKARSLAELEGVTNPSKSHLATLISDFLFEDLKFSISERRLRDYYNEALSLEAHEDINIAQKEVINGLCQYIGYPSYKTFKGTLKDTDNHKETPKLIASKPKPLALIKKHKTLLLSLLVASVLVTYIVKINQQCWMVWNGESYEQAPYKAELFQNGTIKPCNPDRLDHFKKVIDPNCSTEFFNPDGSAKVWYVKNKDGTLDCFTSYGLHPETGKTLKPITKYMIENYLCEGY